MTLTIELPPDVEARLQAEAARHGEDPAAAARRLIETALPAGEPETLKTLTPEERERLLDELAENDRTLPDLPAGVFSRANIYAEVD